MIEDLSAHLLDNIEALSNVPQETIENLETACAVASLSLPDNKILCVASALCAPLCQLFSEQLNLYQARTAQTLNAMNINNHALYPSLGVGANITLEFHMLAHPEDTLLLITQNAAETESFADVIHVAHEYNMPIIALCNRNDNAIKELLTSDEDILLVVSANNAMTFLEVALTILNSLLVVLTNAQAE